MFRLLYINLSRFSGRVTLAFLLAFLVFFPNIQPAFAPMLIPSDEELLLDLIRSKVEDLPGVKAVGENYESFGDTSTDVLKRLVSESPQPFVDTGNIMSSWLEQIDYVVASKLSLNTMQLTTFSGTDRTPSWSPDGTKIIFASDRSGNMDIWVMDSDGGNLKQLTTSENSDFDPAWSPDGTKIAFTSTRSGNYDIWVMDSNGGNYEQLTSSSALSRSPTWSSDGKRIAYFHDFDIWVMDSDGRNMEQLTTHEAVDYAPSWNPIGNEIAFVSDRLGNDDIWVIDVERGNKKELTTIQVPDLNPSWSPDGENIAYESYRAYDRPPRNIDIWVMDSDGGNKQQITSNLEDDREPSWSPDGSKIVFTSFRSGNEDIWAVEVGESGLVTEFELKISPDIRTIHPGGSTAYTVSIVADTGFTSPVSLQISGLPAEIHASFTPTSLNPTLESALKIETTASINPETYRFTVTASGGGVTRSSTSTLAVESAKPNETVEGAPIWVYESLGNGFFWIDCVSISTNGQSIASASYIQDGRGGYVTLFSRDSSVPIWRYRANENLQSLSISDDGDYILAGGDYHEAYLFDKKKPTPIMTYQIDEPILATDISGNGAYISLGSIHFSVLSKWSNTPSWEDTSGGQISSLAFSSDGKYLAVRDFGGHVDLYEAESSRWVQRSESGDDLYGAGTLSFSDDGNLLVSSNGGEDNFLYLFKRGSGYMAEAPPVWKYDVGNHVFSTDISNDGGKIIAGVSDGPVYMFRSPTPEPIWVHKTGEPVVKVAVSADGRYAASGTESGVIYFYDTSSSTPLWTYWADGPIMSLSLPRDGSVLVASSDHKIYFFNSEGTNPDFSLIVEPKTNSAEQGGEAEYLVSLNATRGFESEVDLSLLNPFEGVEHAFSPTSILPGQSSTLTLSAGSSASTGSFSLVVVGSGDEKTREALIKLNVVKKSEDFTIEASPTKTQIVQGESGNFTVTTETSEGFTSNILLELSGLPKGVEASFQPNAKRPSGSSKCLLVFDSTSSVEAGTYPLTITARAGDIVKTKEVTLSITSGVSYAKLLGDRFLEDIEGVEQAEIDAILELSKSMALSLVLDKVLAGAANKIASSETVSSLASQVKNYLPQISSILQEVTDEATGTITKETLAEGAKDLSSPLIIELSENIIAPMASSVLEEISPTTTVDEVVEKIKDVFNVNLELNREYIKKTIFRSLRSDLLSEIGAPSIDYPSGIIELQNQFESQGWLQDVDVTQDRAMKMSMQRWITISEDVRDADKQVFRWYVDWFSQNVGGYVKEMSGKNIGELQGTTLSILVNVLLALLLLTVKIMLFPIGMTFIFATSEAFMPLHLGLYYSALSDMTTQAGENFNIKPLSLIVATLPEYSISNQQTPDYVLTTLRSASEKSPQTTEKLNKLLSTIKKLTTELARIAENAEEIVQMKLESAEKEISNAIDKGNDAYTKFKKTMKKGTLLISTLTVSAKNLGSLVYSWEKASDVQLTLLSPSGIKYDEVGDAVSVINPETGTWTLLAYAIELQDEGEEITFTLNAYPKEITSTSTSKKPPATTTTSTTTSTSRTTASRTGDTSVTSFLDELFQSDQAIWIGVPLIIAISAIALRLSRRGKKN